MNEFLVEVFAPRGSETHVAAAARRAREAALVLADDGVAVRYVRSTYIREDETCFYVFAASSKDAVARAVAQAELDDARIIEAETAEGPAVPAPPPQE